jgi:hypothetical protein
LHHLICGRKRTGLQSILEETASSIYFPSPFIFETGDDYSPSIHITGESNDVVRVKDMLTKLASQKVKRKNLLIRRQVIIANQTKNKNLGSIHVS